MNTQCCSNFNNNKKNKYKQCNLDTITCKSCLNKSHSKKIRATYIHNQI